jgi:hypothetical protein
VDWTILCGRDKTDVNGAYTLFLDPGTYIFSIEKNSIQMTTISVTVPSPE